jgi:hypothetical protein
MPHAHTEDQLVESDMPPFKAQFLLFLRRFRCPTNMQKLMFEAGVLQPVCLFWRRRPAGEVFAADT